jgi:flagellar protein FlbT
MIIHLKKNEKLFINGAVIRLDRRGSIELLNDAQFLLSNHVLQAEDAKTPLRSLYFVVQTMIMDPQNSELTRCVFVSQAEQVRRTICREGYHAVLDQVEKQVAAADYYAALKTLRSNFKMDDEVVAGTSLNGADPADFSGAHNEHHLGGNNGKRAEVGHGEGNAELRHLSQTHA